MAAPESPKGDDPTRPNLFARAGNSIRIAIAGSDADPAAAVTTEVTAYLSEVHIKLSDLPPYVAERLAVFDADGDGTISTSEIMRHGAALEHARHKAR